MNYLWEPSVVAGAIGKPRAHSSALEQGICRKHSAAKGGITECADGATCVPALPRQWPRPPAPAEPHSVAETTCCRPGDQKGTSTGFPSSPAEDGPTSRQQKRFQSLPKAQKSIRPSSLITEQIQEAKESREREARLAQTREGEMELGFSQQLDYSITFLTRSQKAD